MNRTVSSRLCLRILITSIVHFGAINPAAAQSSTIDWKFYGGASKSMCFYDAKGVMPTQGNAIKVWTKCLLQKDLDSVDIKKSFKGKILEDTAQKVAKYYLPPIVSQRDFSVDEIVTITQYEVTADLANIEPHAQILYELNCQEKMIRELSISVRIKGKSGHNNDAQAWHYTPPETNGATLLRLLCPII